VIPVGVAAMTVKGLVAKSESGNDHPLRLPTRILQERAVSSEIYNAANYDSNRPPEINQEGDSCHWLLLCIK
jgi:hypothetical protein